MGTDYGHAEARKSPVVDGRVNRDSAGLEVRYPVILSPVEKDMARKIVLAFKQTVCGFDILRVNGRSYCCDVNGFSFVKNSRKYYDDASQVLCELMIQKCRPEYQSHPSSKRALTLSKSPALTKANLSSSARLIVPRTNTPTPPLPQMSGSPQALHSLLLPEGECVDGRPPSPSLVSVSRRGSQDNLDRVSADEDLEELRCVIAVIRHGDRTPKQKMKVKVSEPKFLDYFHAFAKTPRKDLKVKSRSALVRFLDVTREIIADGTVSPMQDPDLYRKLRQIRDVLERWEISGINRKLQMKPQKWTDNWVEMSEERAGNVAAVGENESSTAVDMQPCLAWQPQHTGAQDSAGRPGLAQNISLSAMSDKSDGILDGGKVIGKATEVLLILKWGGDLTPLGREQAELMGARFRHQMYPDNAGGGVLRLHATYRHDLKIKASDEGRVMKTAAAFTKGLLELEGQLTPILASLVTVEEKNRQMLDRGGNIQIKEDMDRCKEHLNLLQTDREMDAQLVEQIASGCPKAVRAALLSLGNPLTTLRRLHYLIGQLCMQLQRYCDTEAVEAEQESKLTLVKVCPVSEDVPFPHPPPHDSDMAHSAAAVAQFNLSPSSKQDHVAANKLYLSETFSLMLDRWEKLNKDFLSSKTGLYDLTKVPDVYDMIRYDVLHNSHVNFDGMEEIYRLASALENSIVPQEYGKDSNEKRIIGSKVCGALLEKIRYDLTIGSADHQHDVGYLLDRSHAEDLEINSLGRAVRTRLYFTSESHLHTLLNAFRYTVHEEDCAIDPEGMALLDNVSELSYMTQIVIRLFENKEDPNVCRAEVSFSPGAINDPFTDKSSSLAPYITLSKALNQSQMIQCLTNAILASNNSQCTPRSGDDGMQDAVTDNSEEVIGPDHGANSISKFNDSPAPKKVPPRILDKKPSLDRFPQAPSLRRTFSVTVVSDPNPLDPWEKTS